MKNYLKPFQPKTLSIFYKYGAENTNISKSLNYHLIRSLLIGIFISSSLFAFGQTDNYPWPDSTCNTPNWTYGMYYKNCTDWVAWKINENQDVNSTTTPHVFWNNMYSSEGNGGNCSPNSSNQRLSHACRWDNVLQNNNYFVSSTPTPGAIAQWNAGESGADASHGHVAYVESVNSNNTANISEYNKAPLCGYSFRNYVSAPRYIRFNRYMLNGNITINPNPIQQNQPVSISAQIKNNFEQAGTVFVRCALYNSSNQFVGVIQSYSRYFSANETKTLNFYKSSISSNPGSYKIWIETRVSSNSPWTLVHKPNSSSTVNVQIGYGGCTSPTYSQQYASNITQSSARIYCTASGSYRDIQVRQSGSSNWTNYSSFTGNYKYISSLQAGTAYEYQTRRKCNNGQWSNWSSTEAFTTSGGGCTPPTYSQQYASNITQSSARIYCTASGSYRDIQVRQSGSSNWTNYSSFTGNYKYISSLQAGTAYEYQTRRKCNNGQWSNWSSTEAFTTSGGGCTPPTYSQQYASNITQSSARIYCTASGSYRDIKVRQYGSSNWTNYSSFTGNYKYISSLQAGTAYEYQTRRKCNNGQWSNWSSTEAFTTSGGGCTPPTYSQQYASNITQSSARIYCTASGSYRDIKVRQYGSSNWTNYSSFTGNYKYISSLQVGTAYEYQTRRKCNNGQWSNWSSTEAFTTSGGGCTPPTYSQQYASNITQSSARIYCTASGSYRDIQVRQSGSSNWTNYSSFTGNYKYISSLQAGTAYEYQTRRKCNNGQWSNWSSTEAFTTSGGGCTPPTYSQQYASNITQSSARIYCTASGSYRDIQVRQSGSSNWTNYSSFTGNYKYISSLQAGTAYEYQTRRKCNNGQWSNWSSTEAFTTSGGGCTPPTYSQQYASNITQSSARIYCTASGSYRDIKVRQYGSSNWTNYSSFTGNYKYISSLQAGTAYEYQTRRKCTNGQWSNWSSTEAFTTSGGGCTPPTYSQQYASNITQSSARIYCTASGSYRDIQVRQSGSLNWMSYSSFTGNYKYISSLQAGTAYEYQTRRKCNNGQWSTWSSSETFVTTGGGGNGSPSNDNPCGATTISVLSSCSYTSINTSGATTTTNPNSSGISCPNPNKDVWVKLTMPSSGYLTIRTTAGSLSDAVMAVYYGSCSSMTYITCEDDNSNGNGSMMPVINLVGGAGYTIYVRIWGYQGATGTLSICALNYSSTNMVAPEGQLLTNIEDDETDVPGELVSEANQSDNEISSIIGTDENRLISQNIEVLEPGLQAKLYPNPAFNYINLDLEIGQSNEESYVIQLYNSQGLLVQESKETIVGSKILKQIDLSSELTGMYIIKVTVGKQSITEKILVAR